jgi:glycosyltransferase involved in cell wall biosynthesis
MNARPISVLYFTRTFARGGAEEHILTLLRGLDRAHFRLHLVCPPDVASKLRPDLPADVELLPLSLRRPRQFTAAVGLGRILRERRVDILHSHLFYSSRFASPIGWLCRVPVILETPHLREHWRTGWFKSHFVVDRFAGRFVDYYVAVSEANARYLAEEKCLPQKKIMVIHNGCDVERFDPAHQPPPGLKASLGFHEADPVLVVAARLEPQKGHRVLLRALQNVRREFPQVRLVCLGEGCLRDELGSEARGLGLADSVRFVGFQCNVADWLALAVLTVLPSFFEGLPLTAIESLAAGRPVVATSVDGTPEIVIDGKTGLTVPPGDAERLAGAICRLLRQPELRNRLGEAGRKWVMEHFTQERQIRQTQELYFRAWERHIHGVSRGTQLATATNTPAQVVPTAEQYR